MDDVKVTITNLDGNFALFEQTPSEVTELERYDTLGAGVEAATELLSYDPRTLFLVDRKAKEEAYRVTWPGREKPVEEVEPAPAPKAE